MWQTMSNPSMIGPSLPPHLTAARSTKLDEGSDESSPQPVIGPQPPSTDEKKQSSSKASYGPSLPPGMTYGPSIPEDSKDISVYFVSTKHLWVNCAV